jgi:hypothetical protein
MKWKTWLLVTAAVVGSLLWYFLQPLDGESNTPSISAKAPPTKAAETAAAPSANTDAGPSKAPEQPWSQTALDKIAAECRSILTNSNLRDRFLAFRKLLDNTYDPAALRKILATMDALGKEGFPLREEWDYMWYFLAGRDAIATMKLADGLGQTHKWFSTAFNAVTAVRAREDPIEAMHWLNSREDVSEKVIEGAALNIVRSLAATDVAKATEFVRNNFPPKKSGSAQYAVTSTILRQKGVPGLHEWFAALPDDAARQQWFPSMSNRLAEADKEVQQKWLAEQASKPWRNDRAYVDALMAWADVEPEGAMAFAMKLPPTAEGNYTGLGTSAYGWLVKDAPGFAQFYAGLPDGPHKTAILKALQLGVADPDMPNRKNAPARAFLESLGALPLAKP